MADKNNKSYQFNTGFLKEFTSSGLGEMPFSDSEIIAMDRELEDYENQHLDIDVEKYLIGQNEFLTSFGISKAEESTLTVKEAEDVYKILQKEKDYDFIALKLSRKQGLTQKDYEKLEFINVVKTFRQISSQNIKLKDLTPNLIKKIHFQLTKGMDVFKDHLIDFSPYHSGVWRKNDLIRVGHYVPPSYKKILPCINELLLWFEKYPGVTNVGIFHALLYAVHPFHNGNKRVCRILEHLLLRIIGLNSKNIYSPSYYYHTEKPRYYKYLLGTLERKNLKFFVSFFLESIVLSTILVLKAGLEAKRKIFLERQDLAPTIKNVLQNLFQRSELRFNDLYSKSVRKKMARQTFVNYLHESVDKQVLVRREAGRNTFYRLNIKAPEEDTLARWIAFTVSRLAYVPDHVKMF